MEAPKVFIAQPKDDSLEALLSEGFAAIERRFMALDQDKAGMFTFKTLAYQLATRGLNADGMKKLEQIYQNVDKDGTGTLDFPEYLALLYLWSVTGESLSLFFKHPQNVAVTTNAFKMMEAAWIKYDADLNRRLQYDELSQLMSTELPTLWDNSQGKIDEFYPESDRGEGMRFPLYMHLLYACLHNQPDHNIPGNYTKPVGFASNEGGQDSEAWNVAVKAFKAIENDFDRFDSSKDGFLDLNELTRAFPVRTTADNLSINTRIESYYFLVDADNTKTLDFFEFIYLAFLMSQDGCYADLVPGATDSHSVKMLFLRLLQAYTKADSSKNKRLSKDEIEAFFQEAYALVPDQALPLFDKLCYESSSAPGTPVVDIRRVLTLVYHCVISDPKYPSERYSGGKPPRDNSAYDIAADADAAPSHPPRIDPVRNSMFQGTKQLGKGGQGEVWLGTYDGAKVAAKVMMQHPGMSMDDIVKDLRNETELLYQIDHPHCHFMLGVKLLPDAEGGPLMLTEVCDLGSLFDLYSSKGYTFKDSTAWRLARECAAGFEFLHGLGYMHRDIKSLNVFMAEGFVAKVADFGMASPNPTESECMGTPIWMAPEVLQCNPQLPGGAPRPYDKRCDIFSYAILVWEIYHCRIPYTHINMDPFSLQYNILRSGLRPEMTGLRPGRPPLPPGIADFIKACWEGDPNARVQTFTQALQMLEPLKPAA